MAFKFLFFAALVAVARAGVIAQPGLAYSSPLGYAAPAVSYAAPVAKIAAPLQYASPLQYAAPVAKIAAPLQYASPLQYATPVAKIAAPLAYAAPVAKIAAPLAYAAPAVAKVATIDADYDPNPQYSYAYDIQDSLTGDSKSQKEVREGDVVKGSYSVVDPDGVKRTVDYTADPHNGFNAVVSREPLAHAVKVAAVAPAYPQVAKIAAPLAYAAPVAKIAAPLAYASQPLYH